MQLSYARHFEDIMLLRALRGVQCGYYLDIGAGDPDRHSVSLVFHQKNWRGLHVEAASGAVSRLRAERPGDEVLEGAVGASADAPASLRLSQLLDKFATREVHWLRIGYANFAGDILASWDDSVVRPWVVVVACSEAGDRQRAIAAWEPALIAKGYVFAYDDAVNRFYVVSGRDDLRQALAHGPCPADDFSLTANSPYARALRTTIDSREAELKVAQARVEVTGRLDVAIGEVRAELSAEIERLNDTLRDFQRVLERRDAEAAQAKSQIASLQSRLQLRDAEVIELREARMSLAADLETSEALVENRQHYINSLLSSTSWRVTEPMRRLVHLASHVRHGVQAWLSYRPGSRPHRIAQRLGLVRRRDVLPPLGKHQFFDPIQAPRADGPTVYLFVDHTVGCDVNTGIQRTVRGLAAGLVRAGQRVRFVKWDAAIGGCALISAAERAHLARWQGPAIEKHERSIYLSGAARPQYPEATDWLIVPEATCITNQKVPVTFELVQWAREYRTKIGFVFYDAIPLRRPELAAAVAAQKDYMRALRYVDAVWSISSWSAADLIAFWLSEAEELPPVYAVPLPGAFAAPRAIEAAPEAAADHERLILSVGSIEPRKNQVALVRAFQAHRAAHPSSPWQLVLVGNLHPSVAPQIDAATSSDPAINYVGHVSDEELATLYARCAFTVFPSVEEGYGLPILESLWYGKPSLCADFGSMAEVARDGGCYTCDTRDEAALTKALATLIEDASLRAQLATEARRRPIANWTDYAGELLRTAWPVGQIYFLAEATAAWERNTGIQRIVRQLARALLDLGFDVIPVKFGPGATTLEPLSGDELDRLAAFNGPSRGQWRGFLAPEKATANSWFVMPELPLHLAAQDHSRLIANLRAMQIRSASVFFDAIPWKMTEVYPQQYGQAHARYMTVLADYDVVAAISDYSRNDLARFWQQAPPQLSGNVQSVVLPGEFSESARETRVHVPAADGPIRVLCVGTVEPRKNHETLLRAFIEAAKRSTRPLRLTLVGSNVSVDPAVPERVAALVAQHPEITWERNADDARIRALHEACDFTVYASVEEGFGLPILESLWYGRPVICANFGAMAEVADGGGCVTVDVRDADALAEAIRALAEQPARIEALSREAVSRRFRTWSEYGEDFAARLRATPPEQTPVPADLARRSIELGLVQAPSPSQTGVSALTIYLLVESTSAYERNTGIQRVVRQLARVLTQSGVSVIPVRWDSNARQLAPVSRTGLKNLSRFNGPEPSDWASWREPQRAKGAWFMLAEVQQHWPNGDHLRIIEDLKADGLRCAAIFYDAIPIKTPQLYSDWLSQAHYRYMIELGFYDLVFPISQFVARDLAHFLRQRGFDDGRLSRKIRPVALAGEFPGSPRVRKPKLLDASETFQMLSVGTVEPRKNHETLVKAFLRAQSLTRRPLELTIVGNTNAVDPGLGDRMRKLIAGHRSIVWLDNIDDAELADLQDRSHLTVYPSLEEGFGLPILESLWHGRPVICANFGAMAEAAGAAAGCLTVDVRDAEAFAKAIQSLADDPELLNRLARETIDCPIKTWDSYVDELTTELLAFDHVDACANPEQQRLVASA